VQEHLFLGTMEVIDVKNDEENQELHCIWHSFHHDLLKACERSSLCMQKKCKVGKLEQNWW
jgi:hypothetical protein